MRRAATPNALRPGKLSASTDMTEEKIAVITGGSSGIGLAIIRVASWPSPLGGRHCPGSNEHFGWG
jgi:hypothetical protein